MSTSVHLSYSQIASYLSCGEAYRLTRVAGYAETPAWWFVAGKAVHDTTEQLDRDLPDVAWDSPAVEDAYMAAFHYNLADTAIHSDVHEDNWRSSRKQDRAYWEANGTEHVRNWLRFRQTSGWDILTIDNRPAIEVPVEGTVRGETVKGYIDRIMVSPDGEPVVIDLKTGSMRPKFPLQLGMYAAFTEPLGVSVGLGAYFMTAKGELTDLIDLSGYTTEVIGMFASGLAEAKRLNTYLPNPGIMCGNCGVKQHCRVGDLIIDHPPASRKKPALKPITLKGDQIETR